MAGRVNEGATALYKAQLVDELGVNISLDAISEITLTLYDDLSTNVINGRDGQNILNANDVAISSTGAVAWDVQALDDAIVNPGLESEVHVALFKGKYGASGLKSFNHEFRFRVVNLNKVG